MNRIMKICKLALPAALAVAALSVPTTSQAVAKCPRDIYCLDVWDPVICSNGQVYSNSCYAYRACATGCVPYGSTAI
jgi:hypothetical protein